MSENVDEQILQELRRDSRTPIAKIAEKVGRSRTAVRARIAKLERDKRILSYTITEPAIVATDGIGVIVLVALEVRHKSEAFLSSVRSMPQIASCIGVIGEYDYALLVRQIDKQELEKVLVHLYKVEGVKRTETIMALFQEF
ncbi:Lrp/AsnC family transcriptional regulator [Polycladidibacter hongkongensis]|uniref:Lrp/AsnC family transcriptional regulator n=1 Tax=Polycladidibacter hongkongensis TaxID=1647556 RepID=UPI0008377D1F|nr:Lrp/AsnC family transcriptional regulator [Pseudovibrio hongkongensis]